MKLGLIFIIIAIISFVIAIIIKDVDFKKVLHYITLLSGVFGGMLLGINLGLKNEFVNIHKGNPSYKVKYKYEKVDTGFAVSDTIYIKIK